jgi:flagellar hook protein FlgE
MSLFSSLYTGVTGLNAQSKATSIVANNVANINTTGFKRSDTAFYDIFANSGGTQETPGFGVYATKVARIDAQGGLRQTDSLLDAGITGNGFFPVKTSPYDTNERMLYTRAGQFDILDVGNGEAYLANANGFFAYGWALDASGNGGGGGIDSLVPVQINPGLTEIIVPTTAAQFSINLDANATDINPHFLTAPYNTLPVSEQAVYGGLPPTLTENSSPTNFTRSITMYDSLGIGQNITFEFRKITGPGAHATSTAANLTGTTPLIGSAMPGINAGDTFSLNVGADSETYILGAPAAPGQVRVDTVGELIAHINGSFGPTVQAQDNNGNLLFDSSNNPIMIDGVVAEATLDGNGRLVIYATDPAATISFTENTGTPLTGANTFSLQPDSAGPALSYAPDPGTYPNQGDLPVVGATTSPQHWWEMRVLGPADINGVRPEITKGLMNFFGNGQLNVAGAATLNLSATALGGDFANDIAVDMTGFTQYGGGYNVLTADQNGAPLGERNGIEIRDGGIVTATYSNGESVPLYRLPLAMFVNANGMAEVTGTVYAESPESGEVTLNFAGEGGSGLVNVATLENSNVDLGSEFSKMIVSQRAFSASSQLIRTIDEMTEYLSSLSR